MTKDDLQRCVLFVWEGWVSLQRVFVDAHIRTWLQVGRKSIAGGAPQHIPLKTTSTNVSDGCTQDTPSLMWPAGVHYHNSACQVWQKWNQWCMVNCPFSETHRLQLGNPPQVLSSLPSLECGWRRHLGRPLPLSKPTTGKLLEPPGTHGRNHNCPEDLVVCSVMRNYLSLSMRNAGRQNDTNDHVVDPIAICQIDDQKWPANSVWIRQCLPTIRKNYGNLRTLRLHPVFSWPFIWSLSGFS